MNEIALRDNLEDICRKRDEALAMFSQASALVEEANGLMREAASSISHPNPSRRTLQSLGGSHFEENVRQDIDRAVWRHIFNVTSLGDLFDTRRRRKFDDTLEENPPPVSVDTVMATALNLSQNAGKIFQESVVDLYQRLRLKFKSHSGFGFGPRMIFTNMMDRGFLSYYGESELIDLQRVVYLCQGMDPPERYGGLVGILKEHRGELVGEVSNDYFRLVWYKNGNLHVYILCDEALERMNQILSDSDKIGQAS